MDSEDWMLTDLKGKTYNMRLIRFGEPQNEKPGVLDEENVRRDISSMFRDWDRSFFEEDGIRKLELIGDFSIFPAIPENARYLNREESVHYIGGYCIVNDVSERVFQLERGGQWTKGKSGDNFSPTGSFLLTKGSISNAYSLPMSLSVNGSELQKDNTCKMIFNVSFLIHYLSQFMTLEAGDLILTGRPPGVGMGMKPVRYLKEGDVVELTIEGLGKQWQVC